MVEEPGEKKSVDRYFDPKINGTSQHVYGTDVGVDPGVVIQSLSFLSLYSRGMEEP